MEKEQLSSPYVVIWPLLPPKLPPFFGTIDEDHDHDRTTKNGQNDSEVARIDHGLPRGIRSLHADYERESGTKKSPTKEDGLLVSASRACACRRPARIGGQALLAPFQARWWYAGDANRPVP
jgi:hypothetical protein